MSRSLFNFSLRQKRKQKQTRTPSPSRRRVKRAGAQRRAPRPPTSASDRILKKRFDQVRAMYRDVFDMEPDPAFLAQLIDDDNLSPASPAISLSSAPVVPDAGLFPPSAPPEDQVDDVFYDVQENKEESKESKESKEEKDFKQEREKVYDSAYEVNKESSERLQKLSSITDDNLTQLASKIQGQLTAITAQGIQSFKKDQQSLVEVILRELQASLTKAQNALTQRKEFETELNMQFNQILTAIKLIADDKLKSFIQQQKAKVQQVGQRFEKYTSEAQQTVLSNLLTKGLPTLEALRTAELGLEAVKDADQSEQKELLSGIPSLLAPGQSGCEVNDTIKLYCDQVKAAFANVQADVEASQQQEQKQQQELKQLEQAIAQLEQSFEAEPDSAKAIQLLDQLAAKQDELVSKNPNLASPSKVAQEDRIRRLAEKLKAQLTSLEREIQALKVTSTKLNKLLAVKALLTAFNTAKQSLSNQQLKQQLAASPAIGQQKSTAAQLDDKVYQGIIKSFRTSLQTVLNSTLLVAAAKETNVLSKFDADAKILLDWLRDNDPDQFQAYHEEVQRIKSQLENLEEQQKASVKGRRGGRPSASSAAAAASGSRSTSPPITPARTPSPRRRSPSPAARAASAASAAFPSESSADDSKGSSTAETSDLQTILAKIPASFTKFKQTQEMQNWTNTYRLKMGKLSSLIESINESQDAKQDQLLTTWFVLFFINKELKENKSYTGVFSKQPDRIISPYNDRTATLLGTSAAKALKRDLEILSNMLTEWKTKVGTDELEEIQKWIKQV